MKNGKDINLDKIYNNLIKQSIEEAGLEPVFADEEWICEINLCMRGLCFVSKL